MKIPIYQVDAFAEKLFEGNPAAVCLLSNWLPAETMQAIASENNLAETAFVVPENTGYRIRWFTPSIEVDLCGHATLAAAHVLLTVRHPDSDRVSFVSRSGQLDVTRVGSELILDFPADTIVKIDNCEAVETAIGAAAVETWQGKDDLMLVFDHPAQILDMDPDMRLLAKIKTRGVIVTSAGESCDFVSRFFAPMSGIDEDPVTGSAHTTLTPYWSRRLGKSQLNAQQLSRRGGKLRCEMDRDRVKIAGQAVTYLTGEIENRILVNGG